MTQTEKKQELRAQIAELVEQYANLALKPAIFMPGATLIPPSGKSLDAAEIKNMVDAALDGWLTTGRFNAKFQQELAAFIGVKQLITVNSGSSANLIAIEALDLRSIS